MVYGPSRIRASGSRSFVNAVPSWDREIAAAEAGNVALLDATGRRDRY